jgi:hypothetical protein
MGGILETAGVEGFLATLSSFRTTLDEDDDTARDVIKKMYEHFREHAFSLDEFMKLSTDEYAEEFQFDIGGRAKGSDGLKRAVRDFIGSQCLGSPFDISGTNGTSITVQLEVERKSSGNVYQLRLKE